MKVAILRKKYTFHGGAEGFSSSFIGNLAREGHRIHIFAIRWESGQAHANIHFHRVPSFTAVSFLRDLTFALSSLYLMKKKREDFDIIQSHDKTLCQDIYRAGDGCHSEWLRQRWQRTGAAGKASIALNPWHWLILALERSIFKGRRFRKVIAISEMVKRDIMRNYGVSPSDIEVIYNGVDLKRFSPAGRDLFRKEIRHRHGISEADFVVLFVGSGFERKGVKYLIEAVESLTGQVTVMIVGKGSEKALRPLVRRQKVIFCGPRKDVDKYYAAADIFVFPTMYEPFGNVHLEALASGLPVITTAQSGAAEIIEEGMQGFVVSRPEDVAAIAEKIAALMGSREKLQSMSSRARLLAEEFTFERHMGKIRELYDEVIAEKARNI